MTGVLIKKKFRDRHTHTGRTPHEDNDRFISQATPKFAANYRKLGKRPGKDPFVTDLRRNQRLQHLELERVASRL